VVQAHNIRRGRPRSLALVVLLLAACGTYDDRPAEWSFVSQVLLTPNCASASCHSRAGAAAGLDFSDPDRGYTSLTGLKAQFFLPEPPAQETEMCKAARGGTVCTTPRPMLQPCRPHESRLVQSLRARGAQRMPPDRPMPIADIELIERWILAGAKRHRGETQPDCDGNGADAAGDAQ
jgi:hypothetical protein